MGRATGYVCAAGFLLVGESLSDNQATIKICKNYGQAGRNGRRLIGLIRFGCGWRIQEERLSLRGCTRNLPAQNTLAERSDSANQRGHGTMRGRRRWYSRRKSPILFFYLPSDHSYQGS